MNAYPSGRGQFFCDVCKKVEDGEYFSKQFHKDEHTEKYAMICRVGYQLITLPLSTRL